MQKTKFTFLFLKQDTGSVCVFVIQLVLQVLYKHYFTYFSTYSWNEGRGTGSLFDISLRKLLLTDSIDLLNLIKLLDFNAYEILIKFYSSKTFKGQPISMIMTV